MSVPLQSASLSPGFGLSWQLRVVTEICSESCYGVVDGVRGHTEYLRDGIHPESESESESGKVVKKGVPLQSQDKDISSESGKVVRKGVPLQLQLKEIEDWRKGITSNYQGYYGHNSNSSGRKDPNTMDVDWLSTKELEQHKKEWLCFHCHKPGHIGQNCRNSGTNQKQAESEPQDKKKVRNNMIRKILAAIDDEEKEEEQESKEENKEEGKEDKDKKVF